GFTLFSVFGSSTTQLVDRQNVEVHSWTHDRVGGYAVYLLPNGNIMRPALSSGSGMNGGGAAGLVQTWSPTDVRVWQYQYASSTVRSHHDIGPLPNGNVLLVAWELKTAAQAVQAGLDHSAEIWPDHIVEVQPVGATGGNVVWEWHAWDHLIQDHDPTKSNYGVVGQHPELLDINLGGGGLGGDWMHINAVSYNPEWDQIVISSHTLNEVYVIDHSTTTAEAAGHTGGDSGRGGDILYRWGNPGNYRVPGPPYFNVVHCSIWIPQGSPGAGHLMAFNNREGQSSSLIVEWIPPASASGQYVQPSPGTAFGPPSPNWAYTAAGFYSNHLGGCQRLPNGNTLIAESTTGHLFEVDPGGEVEWDHTPGGQIARALRYGTNHPGIIALGLANGVAPAPTAPGFGLSQNSPNPFRGTTTIGYELAAAGRITLEVYDVLGHAVATLRDGPEPAGRRLVEFDARDLGSGIYFYRLEAPGFSETKKLVVHE
ncbi:MAG TPA: aryl-sulfate sulfotransferase, partial [Candidatus Udaeobacter sp.]|nr:aryl-sulfate sulfotransferase [Candidatus Udaeobacter sp.]